MNMSFEDQIRERAYHIWEASGMTDGRAHEHWACAEQAVRGEVADRSAEPEIILTKSSARKAAAKATTKSTAAKPAAKAKAAPAKVAAKAPRAAKKVGLSASI